MRRQRGFTLVELVLVIVVGGIIAATLVVFFRPAFDSWLALRVRGDLHDQAVTALRAMQRDVRIAVPNSIRIPNDQCFELVPTSTGGRFRRELDTVNDAGCAGTACSAPLDVSTATTQFDVLSALSTTPAANDWVVIDNQNPGDVYAGSNRAQVQTVTTPAATAGKHRITLTASTQFPTGYTGGRFVVVPNSQNAVFYVCSGADGTLDASGNGKGTLYRLSGYGFNAAYPSACRSAAGGAVLATNVRSCRFVYDPNQGATQQSGFVSMQLELARNSETASLLLGAHVVNVP
ncbi:prepilin-type N-terminal cleavage/methylation domain-containing protein [Ideonella sp. BN130291]|uniref:prepilin-type N-terminal cleavage/methylation domain-containing protein n=1 Tax=Ideonella sp. BN130291 TaxID=3112940 RepID=UPI002E264B1D|nr:prepilin-type N-terminal cleavage/methylation domain-containing protein [Ideonella sp. BN130291]